MNAWLLGTLVLAVAALPPALYVASRGSAMHRLVGLQLSSSVVTLLLLGFAQAAGQSSYLVVPLMLVPVSFAGTLVYLRLLGHLE